MSWPRYLSISSKYAEILLRGDTCHVKRAMPFLMNWSSMPWLPSSMKVLAMKLLTEK
ncbi:hypothetical protein D3C83_114140 [compost metagenome]